MLTPFPQGPEADALERAWQTHWRKVAQPGYELPAGDESTFLYHSRSAKREWARLMRINYEFERAFAGFTTSVRL